MKLIKLLRNLFLYCVLFLLGILWLLTKVGVLFCSIANGFVGIGIFLFLVLFVMVQEWTHVIVITLISTGVYLFLFIAILFEELLYLAIKLIMNWMIN